MVLCCTAPPAAAHLALQLVVACLGHELGQLLLGDVVLHVVTTLTIVLVHRNHLRVWQFKEQR